MKSVSTALADHLAGEVTSLATCWKVTRRDAQVLGFTEHDVDLLVEGVTYQAATGFTPTAIENSSALNVDNLDVEGLLDSGAITESDLLAGLYDFAEIEVFQVNHTAPDEGKLMLRLGWLGEVRVQNQQFVAEVRGLTQQLSQTIGALYSPLCRARLGDSRCGINLAAHTVTGSISSVASASQFGDALREEGAGTFNFGKITFTSGANNGLSMEVKEYVPGQFILVLPMPYLPAEEDTYTLSAGCDKTLATCAGRFSNAVNFRGEPHVPGLDRMLETAGTRSSD